jgi:ABC-type glycerol-3-phosphate transport system permease component
MRPTLRQRLLGRAPHAVVAALALVVAIPMLWVVAASLRVRNTLTGGFFDPADLGFDNYHRVLQSQLPRNLLNSLVASGVASILAVAVGTVTAYGFSRFTFRGAKALFWAMLLLQLIPSASLVVPLYKLWGTLGLFNSLGGLGLAYAGISTAVCVLLVKSFVDEIPRDFEEAAAIDGCSSWGTFRRVVMPLLGPAMAAGGIFVFITTWQEFVLASSVTNDPLLYTVTVGLQQFSGEYSTDFGAILAGSVLTALPIVLVFAIFQRQFVRTVVGGVKG